METPQIDHYAASREALDYVDADRVQLDTWYALPRDEQDRYAIGALHHSIGVELKLADIHATLALRDAVRPPRMEEAVALLSAVDGLKAAPVKGCAVEIAGVRIVECDAYGVPLTGDGRG